MVLTVNNERQIAQIRHFEPQELQYTTSNVDLRLLSRYLFTFLVTIHNSTNHSVISPIHSLKKYKIAHKQFVWAPCTIPKHSETFHYCIIIFLITSCSLIFAAAVESYPFHVNCIASLVLL